MIYYRSTRGKDTRKYSFLEAVVKGIAEDGGLLVPESIPAITRETLKPLSDASYQERALFVLQLFQTGIEKSRLQTILKQAYANNFDHAQIAPLKHLKTNQYILELWHGPTLAFKDMALQLMPYFFSEGVKQQNEALRKNKQKPHHYLILVATSGDTGKAALEGYKDKDQIKIMVLYPDKRVSMLQELQMVTQDGNNTKVIAVKGDFDAAQRTVKEIFNDTSFNVLLREQYQTILSSANSINWGRLLPQIIYFFSGFIDLVKQRGISWGEKIDIVVPTGNFGNILAGYYAKRMGLPINKLICASNENNVLTDFIQTGIYDLAKRTLVQTPSPSMDILIASNIERLLYLLTENTEQVAQWMDDLRNTKRFTLDDETRRKLQAEFMAEWVSNEESLKNIKLIYDQTHYLMDPHTSVAHVAAERYSENHSVISNSNERSQTYNPKTKRDKANLPLLICSTAHWAKFTKDMYQALLGDPNHLDEFTMAEKISQHTSDPVPENIQVLKKQTILHTKKTKPEKTFIEEIIKIWMTEQIL